jgi:hypothetical protein
LALKFSKNSVSCEPQAGLARLLFMLRRGGLPWIWRRLRSEWLLPTTRPGRAFHELCRKGLNLGFTPLRNSLFGKQSNLPIETLYAFYDLKVQPITFDVLWFLTGADLERRKRGLKHVYVVIVPGPIDGVREEDPRYDAVIDRDARQWRVHNILIGACSLLPSCAGYTLVGSRHEASLIRNAAQESVYPRTYEPLMPIPHHPNDSLLPASVGIRPIGVLRAGKQALRYVDQWLSSRVAGRRLVTVTLRDYEYNSVRNSNISAWGEFARRLDRAAWLPVFVLDTEHAFSDLPQEISGFEIFREVSWNIALRMALYERAWINMGVNNGPMGLCWLNDQTRYITFKITTPHVPQTSETFHRSLGFVPGESLPFATPFQKWVWAEDTPVLIQREFAEMEAKVSGCLPSTNRKPEQREI